MQRERPRGIGRLVPIGNYRRALRRRLNYCSGQRRKVDSVGRALVVQRERALRFEPVLQLRAGGITGGGSGAATWLGLGSGQG